MDQRQRKALTLTFLVHIILLFIPLAKKPHTVVINASYVPIQVKLVSPPAPPKKVVPVKKDIIPAPKPSNTITTVSQAKSAPPKKAEPPKPTHLPGDRNKPSIEAQKIPITPKSAINNGWTGKVVVDVYIDPEGKIEKIELVKSSGYDILDTSFIRTIQDYYTFLPTRKMGKNESGVIRVEHTFN